MCNKHLEIYAEYTGINLIKFKFPLPLKLTFSFAVLYTAIFHNHENKTYKRSYTSKYSFADGVGSKVKMLN